MNTPQRRYPDCPPLMVKGTLFVVMAKCGVHGFTLILKCIYSKAFLFEMVAAVRKKTNIILWHLIQNKKFRDFNPKSKIFKKV